MLSGPSAYSQNVDNVMLFIVGTGVILLLGITIAMIFFVIKYNRKRHPKAKQIEGNVGLEILWIGIPTIIVIAMFFYGYTGYKELRQKSDAALVVEVTGKRWQWSFKYKNGMQTDSLYIPVNETTKLVMHSVDVNHSLYIPAFRLKEDVLGSIKTYMILTPEKTGTYDIACAEYWGLDHSRMYTGLVVMPKDDFNKWYNSYTPEGEKTPAEDTVMKEALDTIKPEQPALTEVEEKEPPDQKVTGADKNILFVKGCVSCHSFDGSRKIGPSFKELLKGETTVITAKGVEKKVKINDEYLRRAIMEPNAEFVKGYPKYSMPSQNNLTDAELEKIIMVLKGLN